MNKKVSKRVEELSTNDMLKAINAELGKVKSLAKPVYKSEGTVPGFDKNIKDETSEEELIKMYSSVKNKEIFYNDAASDLGLTRFPKMKIEKSSPQDLMDDISLRIKVIGVDDHIKKLQDSKKELEELLSREEKKQIAMGNIKERFGDIFKKEENLLAEAEAK